jgi:NADH:ubiquinone oxidoreductase subunit F (NADH-binding)
MENKCFCALGEFSIMAVLSGIKHFRADFEAHLEK